MNCQNCNEELNPERAELFNTCIKCTEQIKKVGLIDTDYELILVSGTNKNVLEWAKGVGVGN